VKFKNYFALDIWQLKIIVKVQRLPGERSQQ